MIGFLLLNEEFRRKLAENSFTTTCETACFADAHWKANKHLVSVTKEFLDQYNVKD